MLHRRDPGQIGPALNYRVLSFFHGSDAAVVSHGFTKEAEVPNREIELAITRKLTFMASPRTHTFVGEIP